VIPIERLTDADRKWLLTAEGRPIKSGMVVGEPDIKIGAGISKAISRRIAAGFGGKHGRYSDGFGGGGGGRGGRPDRDGLAVQAKAAFAAIDKREYPLQADWH
jgi:hypothetical protein